MKSILDSKQQKILLGIARQAIESHVRSAKLNVPAPDDPILQNSYGCFVTIKQKGELRGCLGNFDSDVPLHSEVARMAASAATRDPRFYPMTVDDLADFRLEISVLSPLQKIEDPQDIVVGQHGIYVEKGFARGVLLPQVAVEQMWSRMTFLQQTCRKAGLDQNDWRAPETEISVFTAEVFGEDTSE